MVAIHRVCAQWGKPHAEGVFAQLGAELLLRQIPNFFCRKLHLYSVQKPVFQAFYSPSPKIEAQRQFSRTFALANSNSQNKSAINQAPFAKSFF
jgi:hypothetical protein